MRDLTDRDLELPTTPAEIAERLREEAAEHWKLLLAVGILCLLAGTFSILVPIVASISATVLVGWALLVGGVFQLAHVFRRDGGWDMVWGGLLAVLTVIAGVWILLAPLTGTITLTVVLVAWFWASGVIRLVSWWQLREAEGAWMLALNGLLNILLGIFIWANLPSSAAWAIGLLVGINLLLAGMNLILMALVGRRLASAR